MKLYNTLTRKIEEFKPLEPGKVKLYTCGLTVYSQPQIGNWVAYIYSDILTRALNASGYDVTRIQNITDVGHLTSDEDAGEDKMLKGALAEGKTAWEVAEKYIRIADHEAYELLGLLRPDAMPRATQYIAEQIDFIVGLEKKGFTYKVKDGIYFDTSRLKDYGKLARLDIGGLRFGARVEDTGKKNPTDFALWKFSPIDQKRDMEWESPWGKGFPGWHIECSAMARALLGDQIDIHTGGIDHIPVHHTNEIAQTESLTGKQFSQIWFHNNHMKVNGTKLSKSLGNSYTVTDIQERGFGLQAFKLAILSKHYRTEGNFTWEILQAAQNLLNKWQATADLRWQTEEMPRSTDFSQYRDSIIAALQDDLNTPKALIAIDALTELEYISSSELTEFNQLLESINQLLGINLIKPDTSDDIKALITTREQARQDKDWDKSDQLRNQLKEKGIEVKDTPTGTVWSRA